MRSGIRVAALLLAPGGIFGQSPAPPVFQRICGACHAVDTVTSQRRSCITIARQDRAYPSIPAGRATAVVLLPRSCPEAWCSSGVAVMLCG